MNAPGVLVRLPCFFLGKYFPERPLCIVHNNQV
jgi:hypothetical protein